VRAPFLRTVPVEPVEQLDTPSPIFEAQRRSWNERYSVHVQHARHWRYAAFGAIGVSLISVAGALHYAEQPRVTPFVVEVDRLGDAVAVKRADVAEPIDPRILKAELARWIWDVRTVSPDAIAQHSFIFDAAALIDEHGAANQQLQDWIAAHNPYKLATTEIVTVSVSSVLPITAKTWRVEWTETTRTRGGTLESNVNWEATVTIAVAPPTTEKQILANPAGVYIENFAWQARL
jgi:type IV secretion system protein TrbF